MNIISKISSFKRSNDGTPPSGELPAATASGANLVTSLVNSLKAREQALKATQVRLENLKPFVLDSTITEVIEGSGKDAELEDKVTAFELVTKTCGIKNVVIAAFVKGSGTYDREFLSELAKRKLIDENCFAFSELYDQNGSDLPEQDLPFGLAKMIQYGIQNAVLEVDVAAAYLNWEKYTVADLAVLVELRCRWVARNLLAGRTQAPASYINLRDFVEAMQAAPERVLSLVELLAKMDPAVRPKGLFIEDASGVHFPFEVGPAVAAVRAVMDANGWDARLLVHVQSGYGLAHATVMECLKNGCDGVWASLCDEAGAASQHASSLVDLVNLTRLGNKHVASMYNVDKMRTAAAQIASIASRSTAARAEATRQTGAQPGAPGVPSARAQYSVNAALLRSSSTAKQPLIPGHA